MADLSPAANAVLDALDMEELNGPQQLVARAHAAAVLRAVADQVAPSDAEEPRNYLPMAIECQRIRAELLTIAAELERNV